MSDQENPKKTQPNKTETFETFEEILANERASRRLNEVAASRKIIAPGDQSQSAPEPSNPPVNKKGGIKDS
jgi:hypothetical protein